MTEGAAKTGLEGVRVVELATVVAGPGAGRYLADFGAEVIKVEAPGGRARRRRARVGPCRGGGLAGAAQGGAGGLVLRASGQPDQMFHGPAVAIPRGEIHL